jgi:hypothetical protein
MDMHLYSLPPPYDIIAWIERILAFFLIRLSLFRSYFVLSNKAFIYMANPTACLGCISVAGRHITLPMTESASLQPICYRWSSAYRRWHSDVVLGD